MNTALPRKLTDAIESLGKIPGVGVKTATRQALQLARWSEEDLKRFSDSIIALNSLNECAHCGVYSDEELCGVCTNPKRQELKTICVVESVTDFLAIEKSEKYFGSYHILGGVLNPLLGVGPDELNLRTLFDRVQRGEATTLILAVNPSVEGDATCSYIRQSLPSHVSVDRIGFGIPIGGSLEYLDSMTISKALENRKSL